MFSKPSRIMPPQVGVGGFTPRPMKASDASVRMAFASHSEPITRISGRMLGRMCPTHDAGIRVAERTAGLDVFALLDGNGRRARDAGEGRDGRQRDGQDDVGHRRAKHGDNEQAQDQRREGQQHVHRLHDEDVEAAADTSRREYR